MPQIDILNNNNHKEKSMSLRFVSSLNSPPFVAAAGVAVIAGLPFVEAAAASGTISLALLKGLNLAAFAGRSDNAIKGLFLSAWVIQVAPGAGIAVTEAIGQAGKLMGLMGIVTLIWTPIFGYLLDKLNRVTGMALAMLLAAIGYSSMGLINSPLENAALPLFVILAIGQGSAIIASVTLVGQEASPAERGTVVATNGWFGAIGILIASLFGGYLFDSISPAAPFVMIGIFQAGVFVYAVILRLTSPGQEYS